MVFVVFLWMQIIALGWTSGHLQDVEGEGEIRVLGLQQGLWTVPTNQVFVRYNFSVGEGEDVPMLYNYTICYWIRAETSATLLVHLSYAISDMDSNTIFLYQGHDRIMAFINSVSQPRTQRKRFDFHPGTWNHLCHVVEEDKYTIFWQGKEEIQIPAEGVPGTPLNGSLVIGQDQDKLGGSFDKNQVLFGEIGQLSIWNRTLRTLEITELASCRSFGRGNIFSLDTADLEVFGDVSETRVSVGYFCRTEPNYFVLPEEQTFTTSLRHCHLLNGTMPVISSHNENDVLLEQTRPFQDICGHGTNWKFWLGITDESSEGTWLSVIDGTPAPFLNFVMPYPSRSNLYNCVVLVDDGTWADVRCYLKKCGICQLPNRNRLFLRGFCFDADFQGRYRISGYFGGRPVFRGHYETFIFWNNSSEAWELHNINENVTVASTVQVGRDNYPLGTNQWKTVTETCGMKTGTLFEMNLSKCADHLFPCKSGHCIERDNRCNLRNDCPDGSDEEHCDVVVFQSSYQKHLPPRGSLSSVLSLTPRITLSKVAKIDDINMLVMLEFLVELTWRDERLSFRHLTPQEDTLIPATQIEQMWIPRYHFLNLEGGQPTVLDEKVMVTTCNGATLPDFNSLLRDISYPGSLNNLTLTQHLSAKFSCSFNLHIYPFDKQECNIMLRLPHEYQGRVTFSEEGRHGTYTGPQELALYTVKDASLRPVQDAKLVLSLRFELHRRQGVILLSTFVPSVLLLLVSWATLFLRDLKVGAGLSLTILLVVYTLFANLLRSVPNTAAIKMIDIWFFFIISLLVLNILVQIFLDYGGIFLSNVLLEYKSQSGSLEKSSPERKQEQIMSIYRSAILLIFLAFNIPYWSLVLFSYN